MKKIKEVYCIEVLCSLAQIKLSEKYPNWKKWIKIKKIFSTKGEASKWGKWNYKGTSEELKNWRVVSAIRFLK